MEECGHIPFPPLHHETSSVVLPSNCLTEWLCTQQPSDTELACMTKNNKGGGHMASFIMSLPTSSPNPASLAMLLDLDTEIEDSTNSSKRCHSPSGEEPECKNKCHQPFATLSTSVHTAASASPAGPSNANTTSASASAPASNTVI